jgi:hypothetical protein
LGQACFNRSHATADEICVVNCRSVTQLAEHTQVPLHPGVGTQRLAVASPPPLPASPPPLPASPPPLPASAGPALEPLVLPVAVDAPLDVLVSPVAVPVLDALPHAAVARGLAPTTETMSRNVRCKVAFGMPCGVARGAPGSIAVVIPLEWLGK